MTHLGLCLILGCVAAVVVARLFALGLRWRDTWRVLLVGPPFIGAPAFGAGVILGGGTFNPWIGAVAGLAATAIFARWVYRVHRPARLLRGLQNRKTYPATLSQLKEDLVMSLEDGVLTREASVDIVSASEILMARGEHALVAEWLSKANYDLLRDWRRIIGANNLALACLMLRDVAAARNAFRKIGTVADPHARLIVQSTEALIQVLEGNYEQALERAAELAGPECPPELEATLLEIEATAYAGLGDLDRAEERLRTLVSRCDPHFLAGTIARGGPAAGIARSVLANAPYR